MSSTHFDHVPVPTNFSRPVHNSWGRVTSTINNDPTAYVTRAHQFCGFPINMPLPGCSEMIGCLQKTNLVDLHECMEDQVRRAPRPQKTRCRSSDEVSSHLVS